MFISSKSVEAADIEHRIYKSSTLFQNNSILITKLTKKMNISRLDVGSFDE